MSLADYYGLPESVVKKMISNGHISCSVVSHFEMYEAYKKLLGTGLTKDQIYTEVSGQFRVSYSTVKLAVWNIDKKS
jgi:hypothetical protein